MDNEKIMREKAEQMTKKAEMKIQQAKEKETKYQQWLKNKKQTDPNFRDYDANPLIIQSYEEFFVFSLFVPSLMISGIFYNLFEKLYLANSGNLDIWLILFPICWISIIFMFQKTHFSHHKIKFTNRYIEFYDYGKLKRRCEIVENKMAKPFFTCCDVSNHKQNIVTMYFMIMLVVFLFYKPILIVSLAVSFCFSYIFIRFFFYIFLNKSLKGFEIFSSIQIDNPAKTAIGSPLSIRYFMIYLYSDEIYSEVKKYFLQKNINIDNLPKRYSIF
ncbi:CCDC34 family protein [Campylobacter sp. JMF_04 NA10]|uniref:hypothetical protein n=1 Tax=Campylobacter sp. JMF_04 NA10 TaxID=2983824 RepID=UPI0022E9E90F|nr:hypothetical protein [Campylobacter sp. JMF_04 NA10]MDA3076661.1 CCDC34 family protein [Campylobacter sp. JMF_04 NA10]